MSRLTRMTKKKLDVLDWLKHGFEEECGEAPYSAESVSHVVNGRTTNSLTRAMRKTLNVMVEEGLLFKIRFKTEVSIYFQEGSTTNNVNVWHYDLIAKQSSVKDIEARRLVAELDKQPDIDTQEDDIDIDSDLVNELSECDEDVNDSDDEESIWLEIMIDHAEDKPSEEEQVLYEIMADEAGE